MPILVANPQPKATVVPNVLWQSLAALHLDAPVVWQALVEGSVEQVEFWVDGRLRWTAREQPFVFGGDGGPWDPTGEKPGPRNLTLRAIGSNGIETESRKLVFVAQT